MASQLSMPVSGDKIAIMTTNRGVIKIKLFEKECPKTVENFTTHAKNGYYEGIIFHRVINDFMIQGGDPTGTGCGGESIWGAPFKDEFSPDLHNLRGALSMANAGPGTNGSQFFIVQAKEVSPSLLGQMAQLRDYFPETAEQAYRELGGTPHLDYRHTVFGQVYDGMDVVDEIAAVKTSAGDRPCEDVVINTIEVKEYDA